MTHETYNVLFLCTGNSARSIIAETLLNKLGEGRFKAYSAGSYPKGQVHSLSLRLLEEQGLPTANLRSKSWDEFAKPDAPIMDFVFTVCDQAGGELCPIWPGKPVTAHWGIPDPAAHEGSEAERILAFRDAFRMLNQRLGVFVALPIKALDGMALKLEVEAIGRIDGDGRAPRVTIYHNPDCGTSRNVLGLIRNSGEEPAIIEYLKTPPSREELKGLIARTGISVRAVLRVEGTPFNELGLGHPSLSDDQLLDAMMEHPILINRPIVVTPLGVKLCRPSETVLDILPSPQRGAFIKENGEPVVNQAGQRAVSTGAAR